MLGRRQPAGVLEVAGHHLLESGAQHLDHQHGLPVGHGEAGAVAVKHQDARVHVGADVAAEEGDSEGVDGGGFMGVVGGSVSC